MDRVGAPSGPTSGWDAGPVSGHLTFRAAEPSDRPALVAIWRRAVDATHDFLAPGEADRIEVQVRDEVVPALDITVAVLDGTPVGWIAVAGDTVEALFVDPSAHRRGVGSGLLEAVTDSLPVVTLEVNEQNPAAVAFYRARGFEQTGRSEHDEDGRPYPLLHMRRDTGPRTAR